MVGNRLTTFDIDQKKKERGKIFLLVLQPAELF
jgi:hypothetical protein